MANVFQAVCPTCSTTFRVRLEDAGRRARCRSCRDTFTIAAPKDLLEDTVLAWLQEAAPQESDEDSVYNI